MRYVLVLIFAFFSGFEILAQPIVNMPDLKGLQMVEEHFYVDGKRTDANVRIYYFNQKDQLLYSCFLNDYKIPRNWDFYNYNEEGDVVLFQMYDIKGFLLKRWNYEKIEITKNDKVKIYKTFSSSYENDLILTLTKVVTLDNIVVSVESSGEDVSYYNRKYDKFGNIISEIVEETYSNGRQSYIYKNYYDKNDLLVKVEKIKNGKVINVIQNIISNDKVVEKKEFNKNGVYLAGEKYTYDMQGHLIKQVYLDELGKEYRTLYWKYDGDFLCKYGEIDSYSDRYTTYEKVKSK